jgi:FkbM family methyltransferase
MAETISDEQLNRLLRDAEKSLREVVDDDFIKKNEHLAQKYSDQDILEIFRLCLVKPSGGSWSPVWQVLLLLFQAAFSESYTSLPKRFKRVGNYLIHRLPAGSRPIVYSFGIGNDISFDKAAADEFDVPIYMYDPTPGVVAFMADQKDDDRLIFKSEGIYSRETTTKLYTSDKVGKLNSSLYPIHGRDGGFELVHCRTLGMFMDENGHDSIDILKMDVEGVADEVLNQVLDETEIRPRQIITEFEIKGIENPITYLPKILDLIKKLKGKDYIVFNQLLTRKASIELIIVHRSLFDEFGLEEKRAEAAV